jgi:hypothetical protein
MLDLSSEFPLDPRFRGSDARRRRLRAAGGSEEVGSVRWSAPSAASWRRLALIVLLFLLSAATTARGEGSVEYAVKATYLYKLAPFVEWPPSAFASSSGPFWLCVAVSDPFGAALDAAVAGQRVGERPILVRRPDSLNGLQECQILFIGPGDTDAAANIITATHGAPVLTVTDGAHNPARKGIVNFVVDSNRVRFEIDEGAAAANGLAISSKLLSLAINARGRG